MLIGVESVLTRTVGVEKSSAHNETGCEDWKKAENFTDDSIAEQVLI